MSSSPPPAGAAPLRGIPNPRRAAEVSQIVLAILAFGAAFTYLGPVLQPFLVAVFLYHAIRFLMRLLTGLRMSPWSAFFALIGLGLISSILLAQFVYRESGLFLKSWPRYEDRIVAFLGDWSPSFLSESHRSSSGFEGVATRGDDPSAGRSRGEDAGSPPLAPQAPLPRVPRRVHEPTELTPDLAGTKPLVPEMAPEAGTELAVAAPAAVATTAGTAASRGAEVRAEGAPLEPEGVAAEGTPGDSTGVPARPGAAPRVPVSERAGQDRAGPERPALARSGLTELFRVSSQDVLNYVFSHGMDAAELIVMVFFYLVFLFLGSRKFGQRILRAFPGERGQRVLAVGQGISESMERFMMVKTVVGLGMAITSALIMRFFGLDHWLLWAFLFFASNYITYIGSIAACVPPCVMAFLDLDSPTLAAVLGGLIILNRLFWIDFVELKMSGQQLNLDPTVLFLWLAYWGWTWGILGLILAYPMMAAVRIALLHIEEARGWSVMLSDE